MGFSATCVAAEPLAEAKYHPQDEAAAHEARPVFV
jgi:hypothetical protein